MSTRVLLFLISFVSLTASALYASDIDPSMYPPEQLVWLRIHDHQATLPQSILELQANLFQKELEISRGASDDLTRRALLAEASALYKALTEIDYFAKLGAFGDWSFILPTHELRDWYAVVVLHERLRMIMEYSERGMVASMLLRALLEAYACKLSGSTPPYLIITDRIKLLEVLKNLVARPECFA